jgi:beta-N-acetylhexosaminidase
MGFKVYIFLVVLFAINCAVFFVFSLPVFLSFEKPVQAVELVVVEEKQQLTLEQALGQMMIIGFEGTEMTPELESQLQEIKPGGVLLLGRNIANEQQVKKLIADLQEVSLRVSGVPLFVAVDQEGGNVVRFPWVERTALSALQDYDHAFAVGQQRGKELQELGVNMNLAPVLDSNTVGDFLFDRTFQQDPELVLELARGFIAGHAKEGVLVVVKHFPGYDNISFNPEASGVPKVETLPDSSLFENVVQSSSASVVMVSHVVYESFGKNIPFPFVKEGIEYMRNTLGSDVFIMSDDITSPAMIGTYGLSGIAQGALQGGVDLLLIGGYPDTALVHRFYQAVHYELAVSYAVAHVGSLFQGLYQEASSYEQLQNHIFETAQKIQEFKKEHVESILP